MEINKSLSLSTGHLTQIEFATLLLSEGLPYRTASHRYGIIIILNLDKKNLDEFDWTKFPNMKPIVEYCLKEGIRYIDFDRDVEKIKKFKTFDW